MFFCQKSTPASVRSACVDRAVWAGTPPCCNMNSLLWLRDSSGIKVISQNQSILDNFMLVARSKAKSCREPNRCWSFTCACDSTEEDQRGRVFRVCKEHCSIGNLCSIGPVHSKRMYRSLRLLQSGSTEKYLHLKRRWSCVNTHADDSRGFCTAPSEPFSYSVIARGHAFSRNTCHWVRSALWTEEEEMHRSLACALMKLIGVALILFFWYERGVSRRDSFSSVHSRFYVPLVKWSTSFQKFFNMLTRLRDTPAKAMMSLVLC